VAVQPAEDMKWRMVEAQQREGSALQQQLEKCQASCEAEVAQIAKALESAVAAFNVQFAAKCVEIECARGEYHRRGRMQSENGGGP
jgi:hypothetical protein